MSKGACAILAAINNFTPDDEVKKLMQDHGADAVLELLRALVTSNNQNSGTRYISRP